jgi:hypothetical protein
MITKLATGPVDQRVVFWCPGCEDVHTVVIATSRDGATPWFWNQNRERPTIVPSILVRGGASDIVCHSFVRDGMIQFLDDSTHKLAGQTVAIPDWPYDEHYGGIDAEPTAVEPPNPTETKP